MTERKNFWESLMDFSFRGVLTPRMAALLYALHLLLGLVVAIGAVLTAFRTSTAQGVLALILAIVGLFLWLLYCRVALEFLLAVFRIAEAASPTSAEVRQERN